MSHIDYDSHITHPSGASRRDVLCAGGAAAFSSLVAALLGGAKPAAAQALAQRCQRSTGSRSVSSPTASSWLSRPT